LGAFDMQVRVRLRALRAAVLVCGAAGLLLTGCDRASGDSIAQAVGAVRELFSPPTQEAPPSAYAQARSGGSGGATTSAEAATRAEAPTPAEAAAAVKGSPSSDAVGQTSDRSMDSIAPEDAIRVYYQFIDDRGQVRFVERLTDVPSAWRDRVGYVEMSTPPPLTPGEARKSWKADPEAVRRKSIELASLGSGRNPNHGSSLILYSADWCGYCQQAKRHLDGAGFDYDERNVDIPAVAQELREKTGRGGVPVLDADGEILRGYRKDQYDRFLHSL